MYYKKILILGSNGFIGKSLKKRFEKKNITINDEKKYEYSYITREILDLKDKTLLKLYITYYKPNIIINAAGIIGSSLLNSEKNEYSILDENIIIISNILECCQENEVDKLILFSSYRVFGNIMKDDYDEFDVSKEGTILKNMGYLFSKRIQNMQMEIFMKNCKTKVFCFIMTNVFGENDHYIENGRIVPSLITKIYMANKNKKDLYINSSYKNKVNLIYMKDIIKIIERCFCIENESPGNIIVFNKNGILRVGELAEKIAKRMNYGGAIYFNEDNKEEENKIMNPNLYKFESFFPGFEFTEIEEGLNKVIDNYLTKRIKNKFL